jgi:hypothetical protein
MSENNTTNKNVREDEIDLLDLFRRMGKAISKGLYALGKAFLISTVFLLKRWLPLGLSIALGIGASYLLKFTSDSFYTSDLVLRNNLVSNSDMIAYLNRLHTYSLENNTVALSEALSISPEKVSNIMDISAFWIIDKTEDGIPDYVDYKNNHDVYDTVNVRMNDRLDLRVVIKTPQDLSLVRNGIIKFIEKDSLLQQRNRVRVRQNLELLAKLDNDISLLDSLQKIKYFDETKYRQPQGSGQMIFLQEQKTQLVYADVYKLYSQKQALESDRDLYKGVVTVLSDFSVPAVRDNGGSYYAVKLVPLFFFLTLMILVLLANRKKLIETYNKY